MIQRLRGFSSQPQPQADRERIDELVKMDELARKIFFPPLSHEHPVFLAGFLGGVLGSLWVAFDSLLGLSQVVGDSEKSVLAS